MLNVVVLPAPFGPSSPTISPALTSTDTPLTTRRPRYSFARFSVANSSPFCDASESISKKFHRQGVCAAAAVEVLVENHLVAATELEMAFGPVPDQRFAGNGSVRRDHFRAASK